MLDTKTFKLIKTVPVFEVTI